VINEENRYDQMTFKLPSFPFSVITTTYDLPLLLDCLWDHRAPAMAVLRFF